MADNFNEKDNHFEENQSSTAENNPKENFAEVNPKKQVYKKIFIVNILIFILLLIGIEIYSYHSFKNQYKDLIESQSKLYEESPELRQSLKIRYTLPRFVNRKTPSPEYNGTSNKPAIITIGCSYTEGPGLNHTRTFAAQLGNYTNRTTYNLGVGGSGPQMVYKQLADKNLKNKIPDVDYVIYTFIYDHISRQFQRLLTYYLTDILPIYKICGNTLCQTKTPFYYTYSLFTVKRFLEYRNRVLEQKERDNGLPLFYKTMEESVKEMKAKYPNAKFVFMEFPEAWMCSESYIEGSLELTEEQIKRLESLGIIYINAEKLAGHDFRDVEKYRIADKDHPNEYVWKELVPLIANKLNL